MPGSRKIDKDKEEQTGPQQTEIENRNFKPVFAFGAKICFEIRNFNFFSCGRAAFGEITQFLAKIAVLEPQNFVIHDLAQ